MATAETVARAAAATGGRVGTDTLGAILLPFPARTTDRASHLLEGVVSMSIRPVARVRFLVAAVAIVLTAASGVLVVAQTKREFDVVGRNYRFSVSGTDRPEIRVTEGDLVRITFTAEDIAHSFTVEDKDGSHYRIMRRAEPGRPVSFDFRADRAGSFRFYCSLTIDDKCRDMQGSLQVAPPKGQ